MSVIFYILPVMVVVVSGSTYRGPSYLAWRMNPTGLAVQWSCKDYGSIDMMVCAVNAEAAQHATLAAQSNVYQFPENLDAVMTQAERSALSAYLESHAVPGDWIAAQDTFRVALRTVTGMFLYMQRLTAMTGNVSPLDWGYTLNTQWKNISAAHQTAISEAATSLGYSVSFIGGNTQVRAILKNFADQWGSKSIYFGFVTL